MCFSQKALILVIVLFFSVTESWAQENWKLIWTGKHDASLHSAEFNQSGTRVITSCSDGYMHMWYLIYQDSPIISKMNSTTTGYACFSPDGNWFAGCGSSGNLWIWDSQSGTKYKNFTQNPPIWTIYTLKYSPDGSILACGGGFTDKGTLVLCYINNSPATIEEFNAPAAVRSIDISKDGTKLVASAGTSINVMSLFPTPTNKAVATSNSIINKVIFSPDGTRIASGDNAGIKIWNTNNGSKIWNKDVGQVTTVDFSPDGSTVVSGSGSGIDVWKTETGELVWSNSGARTPVDFSSDGKRIVATGINNSILVFDAITGKNLYTGLNNHNDAIIDIHFSNDGTKIVSASYDRTAKVWEYKKSILVKSQNTEIKYKVGSPVTIQWSSSNVEKVKLEYTINNGTSWNLIADNIDGYLGEYNWTIPNTISTQCRIKISDRVDPTIKDESDINFTIYDPKLNLTYPIGGEIFIAGTYIDIKWSASNVSSVRVEYTTNNGATWTLVKNYVTAFINGLNWQIPSISTNNCKIRIRAEEDLQVESIGQLFSIKQNLILTYPNGGETWQIGSLETIKWTSSYVENVRLDFSSNQGASWNNIIQNISANVGSYVFPVPNAVSSSCLIKISDVNNPSNLDQSDKTFKISKYTITLTSPNGNEIWQAKAKKNITWSCNYSTKLSLMYTTDEGITWQTIAKDIQSTTNSYSWDIPQINSTKCKLMIIDMNDSSVYDSSDNYFTITTPSITVKTPNGNEKWYAGELQAISWNSNFVTEVSIEKSTNGGLTWDVIIGTLTSSVGVFYWKVTEPYSNNCRIRIKSNSDSSIMDASDNSFSIISPVGVNNEFSLPKSTCLFQNYPNPFNPNTEIRYQLADDNYVTLTMYNALGVEIVKLVNEWKSAGLYRVRFDGSNYPSGIYYYRLQVGKYSETKKTILMK